MYMYSDYENIDDLLENLPHILKHDWGVSDLIAKDLYNEILNLQTKVSRLEIKLDQAIKDRDVLQNELDDIKLKTLHPGISNASNGYLRVEE